MLRLTIATASQIYPPKVHNHNSNLTSRKLQCLCLLKKCSSMKQLYQVHAQIQISGLHKDQNVVDEITQFCALHPSGSLSYARLVIERSNDSSLSSWNNLIRGHAARNSPREAISVFLAMRAQSIRPNRLTYPFLVKACAVLSNLKAGQQIHADVLKHGQVWVVYVQNTLVHFYGSCGKIGEACQVFEEMSLRTVVSWTSVISACVQNSKFEDCMEIFKRMKDCGFDPDEATMVVLLSACAEIGDLSLGKWVHAQIIGQGMSMNCKLGTSLVNMYVKCGDLYCANRVFDRMIKRNVWTWSAMIMGFAQHGCAMEALELFQEMKNNEIEPNYVTFLGVLCACSHAGLLEDAHRFFHEMQHVYRIKPLMEHYGAMVDCFGRGGRLREAYTFILNMPVEPDAVVWRTLLSACNIHDINDYSGVGERARRRLLDMEPRRSGNFVMVANKYAEVGMWEKVGDLRCKMRDRGLRKMAGASCIQVGGSIQKFLSWDGSRVDYDTTYHILEKLKLHFKTVNCEESI